MQPYTSSGYKETRWDEEKALASDREAMFHGLILASVECEDNPCFFDWLVADYPGAFLRLIADFPAREREALILHYILTKSHKQIARVLGCVPSVVTELLKRAVLRLQGKGRPREPFKYSVEHRIDPDVLGCFRVPMADVAVVFGHAASHIRIHTSQTELIA